MGDAALPSPSLESRMSSDEVVQDSDSDALAKGERVPEVGHAAAVKGKSNVDDKMPVAFAEAVAPEAVKGEAPGADAASEEAAPEKVTEVASVESEPFPGASGSESFPGAPGSEPFPGASGSEPFPRVSDSEPFPEVGVVHMSEPDRSAELRPISARPSEESVGASSSTSSTLMPLPSEGLPRERRATQSSILLDLVRRLVKRDDADTERELRRFGFPRIIDAVCRSGNIKLLGECLGHKHVYFTGFLDAYLDRFDFVGVGLDDALRNFLASFVLPVEAQQIDRILEKFSRRYQQTNPTIFANADAAYVLSFSLIMLNTDLHNPAIKHKMTKAQFIRNNRGINNGGDLPGKLLEKLYDNIKASQIRYPTAADPTPVSASSAASSSSSSDAAPQFSSSSRSSSNSSVVIAGSGVSAHIAAFNAMAQRVGSNIGARFNQTVRAAKRISFIGASGQTPSAADGASAPGAPTTGSRSRTSSVTASPALAGSGAITASATALSAQSSMDSTAAVPSPQPPPPPPTTAADSASASLPPLVASANLSRRMTRSDSAPEFSKFLSQDAVAAAAAAAAAAATASEGSDMPHAAADGPSQPSRREGLLVKKNEMDEEGKRAPNRSWRVVYAILADASLTIHREDYHATDASARRPLQAIPLEHSFSFPEYGHPKRAHVFRLVTGKRSSYLFQGISANDVMAWVDQLNLAAVSCTPFGPAGEVLDKDATIAAIKATLAQLDQRMELEVTHRDGMSRHLQQNHSSTREQVLSMFEDWEIKAKQLTEDIRRFRGYLALLERRPSEPDDDDGDYAELERSPAPSRLRRNNSLAT